MRMHSCSVEPHAGVNPDSTHSAHVDVEERGVRKATYPHKKPRALREEALKVGTLDVRDPKIERPSLGVARGTGSLPRVCVAVDDRDRSTWKPLGQGCEHPQEIHTRRHAPPGDSVSHENSKLLDGIVSESALGATHSEQAGLPEHGALNADEHGLLRRRVR